MMTQSRRAAFHPFTTLLSLGLALLRSSPIRSRAGRSGLRGDRAANERRDGVVGASQAEDDLVVRIVERENRAQRFPREHLDAAKRLHDGDGGSIFLNWGRIGASSASTQSHPDAECVE